MRSPKAASKAPSLLGTLIALAVLAAWAGHLAYLLLNVRPSWTDPWMYLHILVQGYLYTGLFITGHDAMHGNIHRWRWVNDGLGTVAVALFAGMSYRRLRRNHGRHHQFPATAPDPDFYTGSQNFLVWWGVFMWRYLTVLQLAIMAAIFHALTTGLGFEPTTVLLFWAVPALLGTLQMFSVGVYWPHRLPHLPEMGPHRARTQARNHLWAMASCYFFGYHREHHENPRVPWWQLYQTKTRPGAPPPPAANPEPPPSVPEAEESRS